jgi:hypothetical protein
MQHKIVRQSVKYCHFSVDKVLSLLGASTTLSPLPGFPQSMLLYVGCSGTERY